MKPVARTLAQGSIPAAFGHTMRVAVVLGLVYGAPAMGAEREAATAPLLRPDLGNPVNPGLTPIDPDPRPPDPEPETIPNPPTQLDLGLKTTRSVDLWWLDRSGVENGYRIERRPQGTADGWTEVGSMGPIANVSGHFIDGPGPGLVLGSGPHTGKRYCYRVFPSTSTAAPPTSRSYARGSTSTLRRPTRRTKSQLDPKPSS